MERVNKDLPVDLESGTIICKGDIPILFDCLIILTQRGTIYIYR